MSSRKIPSAQKLVDLAWEHNGLWLSHSPSYKARPVPVSLLSERVARLAPKMPPKDRENFLRGFEEFWPEVDSPTDSLPVRYADGGVSPAERALFDWLYRIATNPSPTGSTSTRLIKEGEEVDYPLECAWMRQNAVCFGDLRLTVGRDYEQPLHLTHRQLSLHVEFAPLVAAVFLASRLPENRINDVLMPTAGTRPLTSQLLETLVRRRPDNLQDDDFVPYVRWLIAPRGPRWGTIEHTTVIG